MEGKSGAAVAAAVLKAAADGKIGCADSERLAGELGVPMAEVGAAIEKAGLRMSKCQLGLFGFPSSRHGGAIVMPAPEVAAALEREIRAALVDGRMPCAAAWTLAERLGLGRIEIAEACEALGIKIKPCQLGAF